MYGVKLFPIPKFSNYYITKNGDIYDIYGKSVYQNDSSLPLPFLINDDGKKVPLTMVDIASAYYGYLPNTEVEFISTKNDYRAKNIRYKIKYIITLLPEILVINGSVFKQIPNHTKYYINKYGVVYTTVIHRFKRYNLSKPYLTLSLYDDTRNVNRDRYIHQLVYETFIGPRTIGMNIDHIDNHKWNNCIDNLQEITQQENILKECADISNRYNSNLFDNGYNGRSEVWSPELIKFLCEEMEKGTSASTLCDMLKLTAARDRHALISKLHRIRKNPKYNLVYDFSNYDAEELKRESARKYSKPVYKAIEFLSTKLKLGNGEIGRILGIPRQTVYRIVMQLKKNSPRIAADAA